MKQLTQTYDKAERSTRRCAATLSRRRRHVRPRSALRRLCLAAGFFLAAVFVSRAVNSLVPGDVAVVGYDGKNPGDFAFVTLVPVDPSLDITFAVQTGSNVVYRTPPAGLAAGAVVVISNTAAPLTPTASTGTIATNGGYDFESTGDHLDVKQGSTFIYVAENLATPFTEPPGLSYAAGTVVSHLNGTPAGGNNGRYKGSRTGTRQEILDLIKTTTNWEYNATTAYTFTNTPFTIQSSGPRWTGTVADGWRYVTPGVAGKRLSVSGLLPGVQTDNNDAPSNGCSAVRSSSGTIAGTQWLSVYFTNDFPSGLQILSAKVYVQHAGASGGGAFTLHVSSNRTTSGWWNGGVGAAALVSGAFAWTNAELQTVFDVTSVLNNAERVNNCEVLLLNSPSSSGSVFFDYLKLEVEYSLAGPPNVSNGSGASDPQPGSARLNGQLLAGVPDPLVRIYWGDNDGGTTGIWDHVEDLGTRPVGAFYATVSGLIANRQYYYRCYATNMFGSDWADSSASFYALSPAVQFGAASSTGSEAAVQITLPVTLSGASDTGVAVNYAVTGGTAANGVDYQLTPGTVTIPAGATSTSITFSVVDDALDEYDETVVVSLSEPQNATLGANAANTCTITDNDNPPAVSLANANYVVAENAGQVVLAAALAVPSGKPVQVRYATLAETAQPGEDYTATNGTLMWLPGQPLTNTFIVPILNDAVPEPSQTFLVALSDPSNCAFGAVSTSSVLIADDDLGPPSVANGAGATAVTSNGAALNGDLTSDGGAPTEAWVYWGVADAGTNRTAWAAGKRVGTVGRGPFSTSVTGLSRNTRYYYRCLASNMYGVAWAAASTNFLTGPPTVEFAAAAGRGDESITPVAIELRLANPAVYGIDVTVSYAATGGTASNGADYTLAPGLATIPAGSSTGRIVFAVNDDTIFEYDETVPIGISNAVNAVLGTNRLHTYTITDNDPLPAVAFAGAPYTVAETAGAQVVTVTLGSASERDVSVSFLTSGGTAQPAEDYVPTNGVLRWGPGQSGPRTFSLAVLNNAAGRGNRTLYAVLLNAVDCTITGSPLAGITLLEDDAGPPAVANRGAAGVRSTRVALNGEVSAGFPPPAVTVCWGPGNAGTNRLAWANRVSLGAQTGLFSTVVTGLASNMTYYYRCYASNTAGQAWAPSAASFTTLPGRNYYVNDTGTNGDVFCTARGTNSGSGLTPSAPKADVNAILTAYDLGPGDTVYIDTGVYNVPAPLAITAEDTGADGQTVAFVGSTNAAGTVLRGTDISQDVIVADLTGAGHVRFERLQLTGGRHGLYVLGTSDEPFTNVQVVDCMAYSNSATGAGFYLREGAGVEVTRCEAYRNGAYGVRLNNCDQMWLTGNRCDRQVSASAWGISIYQGAGAQLTGNRCSGNGGDGILVSAPYARLHDNVCSSNGGAGIRVTAAGSELLGNLSFANRGYGSSTPGSEETFRNNILYSNTLGNVYFFDINNTVLLENNTCYAGNGLLVTAPQGVTNRHNIIWATGSGNAAVTVLSPPSDPEGFVSDFNNLYATDEAAVGVWTDTCPLLAAWRSASGQDAHSISADPLFAGATADFHLQSLGGSYHDGRWEPDPATSPSVDAGDPGSDCGAEPAYNGLRRNQGAFGGTPEASRTYYAGLFYTITATAGSGGRIEPAGVIEVADGGNQSFTISATAPRYIADVLVDGKSVGATGSWAFVNVRTNHTIHASIGGLVVNTDHGTPISWLEMYGITNDYEAADTNDLDGDGALTWQEYVAGTVPTNPLSAFRVIASFIRQGSNTITWYATTNSGVATPFAIQSSTNLRLGGWDFAASNIGRAASGTNTWSFPVDPGTTPRFYRPWLPPTNR